MTQETSASTQPIVTSVKATLVRPTVSSDESSGTAINAQLNLELLHLSTAELPEEILRLRLRELAIRFAEGVGACHVTCDASGNWDVLPKNCSGRIPRRNDFQGRLGTRCNEIVARGTVQIEALPEVGGLTAVIFPIRQIGAVAEVFLLVLKEGSDSRTAIVVSQQIVKILQVNLKNQSASQNDWKLNSLAAMIELVSKVEECHNTHQALTLIANELARHLNCPHVAVATANENHVVDMVIAGVVTTKKHSETFHSMRQTLQEALLRDNLGLWPCPPEANQLLLAHRQLTGELNCEAVLSLPLTTVSGRTVGSWVFAGSREQVHAERMQRFIRATAPRLAGALDAVRRAEHPWPIRFAKSLPQKLTTAKGKVAMICAAIAVIALMIPMPYRIRGSCSVAPSDRRFAVAPFEGLIARGLVRPGDHVVAGQVLAEMEDRSISSELASVVADRLRAQTKQKIELAQHNIPNHLLAELEAEKLLADENVLRFRQSNLQIRSPIDGVVLAGSLERADAAAVKTGQVLFEIGKDLDHRIEVEVPAADISHIQVGQPVAIWIDGLSGVTIREEVSRIYPRSELRNGKNVFIVELTNKTQREFGLRPGMHGSARIDTNYHCLGWNLFHKPFEYLRSNLTW